VTGGPSREEDTVGLLLLLIVLAIVVGGFGLLVEGLTWLLIIAGILFLAGLFFGWRGRSPRSPTL
jgi:hypothetical protein